MKTNKFLLYILCLLLLLISCSSDRNPEEFELVKPPDWWTKLPRAGFADLNLVNTTQWWFEVYKLPHNIYAFYEKYQFEEVISYLVLGKERAALIGTGTGIGDMKKLVSELTDLPVIVLNSHTHFDHIGDNYQFEEIAVFENPVEINRMLTGYENEELKRHVRSGALMKGLPEEFRVDDWIIPPVEPTYLLDEGTVIDLGERELEVILTPGHSPGHVCFLDKQAWVLFTADLFYPGPLWAFGEDANVDDFISSIKKLNKRKDEFDVLCPGHNETWLKSDVLVRVEDGFKMILSGKGEFLEEEGIRKYLFDGFEIIIRTDMIEKNQ